MTGVLSAYQSCIDSNRTEWVPTGEDGGRQAESESESDSNRARPELHTSLTRVDGNK